LAAEHLKINLRKFLKTSSDYGCDQSLATNALKHLMDQLEERILQTDQLKNVSKHLQLSVR